MDEESVPRAVVSSPVAGRLRRDLGALESYAALLGILIGAGIFTVTSDAGAITGPSVILGYVVLFPVILATSVPYAAFLSTPLGQEPGGEYTHISRTLGERRPAFVGAWLKIISYIGAEAFLANSLADYLIAAFPSGMGGGNLDPESSRLPLALASLLFFFFVHVIGVRWFGRLQVMMCALLGVSLLALIGPGLFAIRAENYQPFITHGAGGFLASLAPLFFSYAGFESLAQTAGEVKDSTRRLPMVFLKGISGAALIFVLMSVVAFGVLPLDRLAKSSAPMAEVAAVYLPAGAAWFVTFGAIMAITTSMNSTMLVPSRLVFILSRDGLAPGWIGAIHPRTGTPVLGLALTFVASAALLIGRQISLALNVAVFALVILYFLHSLTFLLLPRRNPSLARLIEVNLSPSLQRAAALISLISMGVL
ncbi:MAG: APC family permease, partial [Blastocatellia bacterium]